MDEGLLADSVQLAPEAFEPFPNKRVIRTS